MDNFGQDSRVITIKTGEHGISSRVFIDSWGAGPFTLMVRGKRYYFSDCDMFGPLLENKHGKVFDAQPTERNRFWAAYSMWRKLGRKGKMVGRWTVCRWRQPRAGQYWKDRRGASHFICDPEFDPLGYYRVDGPITEAGK